VAPLAVLARNGVLTAVASNNICNPFTPYGDANLVRIANLFANVAHLSSSHELGSAFRMISANAARLMDRDAKIEVGMPADLLAFDAASEASVVRTIASPLTGWRAGRKTFQRPSASFY
jgi:cytosine deaminase